MRPLAASLLAAAALAASACSSGSESAADAERQPPPPQETTRAVETRIFGKAELSTLALQPSDAPAGMRYTKIDSGPKTLLDAGIVLDDQVAQIKGLGIRGIYDATFDSRTTDLRLVERIWLFAEEEGAERWFEKSRTDQQVFGFEELDAPPLGQASWAGHGNVGANVLTYVFRLGNVVVVTSYSTQTQELTPADVLAAARDAEARLLGAV